MEEESVQDYILELIFNLLVQIRALNNNQLKSQPSTHTITQLTKVLQNTLINNQKIIQAQARNLNIKQEVNLLYDNINQFQELVKSGEIDRVIDKVQQVRLSDPQTKTQITSLSNEITTKLLTELLQQKESISEFTKEQVVELTTEVIRSLSSETLPVELTRNISNILLLELPQQIAKDLSNELLKVVTTEHSIASEYRPESAVEINKERFVELASERLVKVASQVLTERSRFPYQIYNSNVVNRQAHIQAQAQKAQGYQLEGLVLQHHQDQLTLQARQQLIDRTKLEQQSQLGQQTILEQRSQQLEQTQIEQQSQSLEQIQQVRQLVPGILYEEAGHEFGQRPTGRPPLSMGDVAIDSMMSSWQTNNATNWQLNFTNSWQNDVYLAYLTQNNITQDYGMQEYAIQNYIAEQLPNIQSKALNKALVKAIKTATLNTIKPADKLMKVQGEMSFSRQRQISTVASELQKHNLLPTELSRLISNIPRLEAKAQSIQLNHQDQLTLQARKQLIDRTRLEQQSQLVEQLQQYQLFEQTQLERQPLVEETLLEQHSQQLEQTQIERQQLIEQIQLEQQYQLVEQTQIERQQLIEQIQSEQQSQLGQQTILEHQLQLLEQIQQVRQLVPGILYEESSHEFGQRSTGRPPLSMGDVAIEPMISSWQTNNATNWQSNFTNSWQNAVYLAYLTQNNITQDYGMQEYAIQNYIDEQLPNIQSKALNKALVKAIQAATLKTIKPASANTLQTVVDHITAKAMKTFDDRIVAKAMKTFDDRIVAKAMKTFDDRIVAKAMKTFDDRIVAKAMKTVEDIIKADNMLMIANRPLQISATDNELQESQLATTLPAALPKVIAAISTLLPSDTPIEIIDSVKRRIVNAVTRTSMISTSIEDSRKQVRKVVSKITGDLQLNHKIDVSQEFLIDTIQSAIEAEYTSYQKLPGKPEFIYGSLQQSDDQIGSRMVIVNQPPVIGDIIHRQTPSITAPSVDSVQLEADTYAESMKVQYQSEPSYSTDSTTHHVFPSQAADADLQRQIDQRIEEIDFESIISVTSIADKVYQKLERRLTSERRRRGLL
jgi:hypothetical protein